MDEFMCTACYHTKDSAHLQPGMPPSIEYGWVGNTVLIYNGSENKYQLLGDQGHRNDEVFTFPAKPYIEPHQEYMLEDDPDYELTDEEQDEWDKWYKDLFAPMARRGDGATDATIFQLDPMDGYRFVKACLEQGYKPESGDISGWVINKCGQLIAEYEARSK